MDKTLRNKLKSAVTECRKLLEESVAELLEGQFGIFRDGRVEETERLTHLSTDELRYREHVVAHLDHIRASGSKPKDAVAQLIREAAFTHLNRLCAYKMMAQRGLMRDPVGKGLKSSGFLFYLADHPEDENLYNSSQQDLAFRHYLESINDSLSSQIGVLFARDDVATPLFPPHRVIEKVLELINSQSLQQLWSQDETIGWIFQYFTPKELRDKARKESAAPRNSYEMSFRNQFFTPRYVVEFLVDNTLGRTWFHMRDGQTSLAEKCRYLTRTPSIQERESDNSEQLTTDHEQRARKDPREIRVLDPACGSGHFLLYCFELFQTIYEEAYSDSELGPRLQREFPDEEEYKRHIPKLILAHNLHGIDIDLRVIQLAALALWLRAQRAFHEMGLKGEWPKITHTNLVCAEPMPGEKDLLEEFISGLDPHPLGKLIGELVRNVFDRMKLAGEAGALVRIEDDIREPIEEARKQWQEMWRQRKEREERLARKGVLFDYEKEQEQKRLIFDPADISDEKVWHEVETEVTSALRDYARRATNGKGLLRRLFAEDAEQGFAFIDLCRHKFDVVLMNPPFGDASLPSKPYIDETYGDTKGDVYKAFVECFQDRLVPAGFLGIISSRTGFFLSSSNDWRERIVLRVYRPLLLADFGIGVLDAMVETAAYVLRSLTEEEDRQLALQLAEDLQQIPTDKNGIFSTKKYELTRGLKRHQANDELRRLYSTSYIKPVTGGFPRWLRLDRNPSTAALTSISQYPKLICLRLTDIEDKQKALDEVVHNADDPKRFVVAPEQFQQLRSKSFSYWLPRSIFDALRNLEPVKSSFTVRSGSVTFDDFRFLRLCIEIPPHLQRISETLRWQPISKGGAFSEYYADIHLLIDWKDEGAHVAQCVYLHRPREGYGWGSRGRNLEYFGKPSVTWSRRSQKGFSARVLPAGNVFSDKSPVVQSSSLEKLWTFLGISNTTLFRLFLQSQISFGSFEVGAIERSPMPPNHDDALVICTRSAFDLKRSLDVVTEVSHLFHMAALLHSKGATFIERIEYWLLRVAETNRELANHRRKIDDITFRLYGTSDEDRRLIEASVSANSSSDTDSETADTETEDETEDDDNSTDQRQLTADFISYAVGSVFGRWDVRFAIGERPAPKLPDPFAPLPICAPGALIGEDSLPLSEPPAGYPLRVDSDGILVDDPTHTDDLATLVTEFFDLIWPKAVEARELEACALLGVKTLREYFRKPAAGGFWIDHVKRYSKSRRKAPIYWLLRSSKGNYAIWLYYHRLDKDILFKVLLNYVEPKLRLEENNLNQLKERRETVGTTGGEGKQLEKDLDKQESFLSELYDFRDKLKTAADLNLEPDLNDGVVLNIAPLWQIVPWKEAEKYWKELLAGKYDWSSIGKQLRERGLVKE